MSWERFQTLLYTLGDMAGWASVVAFILIFEGVPAWPFFSLFSFFLATWIIRPSALTGILLGLLFWRS